jgi:hypothetical protein
MTPKQLLDLLEQRTAEAKAMQRTQQAYFGKHATTPVELKISEADEAAECLRQLQARGTVT